MGDARSGSHFHASLWSGTAASWVDLHALLPQGLSESFAEGIWHDVSHTYVVGGGYNTITNQEQALLWIGPAQKPVLDTAKPPPERTVARR